MKVFKFWKDNRVDNEFEKTQDDLERLFRQWLPGKEKEWLEYYSSEVVIRSFLTDKDGVSSVFKESDFWEIYDFLKPIYLQFVYPQKTENE